MTVFNADQNQGAKLCVWSARSVWDRALRIFPFYSYFLEWRCNSCLGVYLGHFFLAHLLHHVTIATNSRTCSSLKQ